MTYPFDPPQLFPQCISQLGASKDVPVIAPNRLVSTVYAHAIQQPAVLGRAEEGVEPGEAEHFVSTTEEYVRDGRTFVVCVYGRGDGRGRAMSEHGPDDLIGQPRRGDGR